jgi:hypothetical protein
MKIDLDGLSLEHEGFGLADQAFAGHAVIGSDGSVERIHLEGTRLNKLRLLEKKMFRIDDSEPLFWVLSAAIKAAYGQQIVEYVEWNSRQRPMADNHRSMEAA